MRCAPLARRQARSTSSARRRRPRGWSTDGCGSADTDTGGSSFWDGGEHLIEGAFDTADDFGQILPHAVDGIDQGLEYDVDIERRDQVADGLEGFDGGREQAAGLERRDLL